MVRKLFFACAVFFVAGAILVTSIFRSAAVKYNFYLQPTPLPLNESLLVEIDYRLPTPGHISPDSPLWPLKATRDKLWLAVNPNPLKKAEITLLIADERLASAEQLFFADKHELSVSVIKKSEIYLLETCDYLEEASDKGMDVVSFAIRLSLASLKHRQVLETIHAHAPEDARAPLLEIMNNSKLVYEKSSQLLNRNEVPPPPNPFP